MKLVFSLLLFTSSIAFSQDTQWSDSGVMGPPYATILAEMQRIQRENPDLVRMVDYGSSAQGRPLRMLVLSKEISAIRQPTLVVTESIHGNEYLNIADRLPEQLIARAHSGGSVSSFLNSGGNYLFVPVLNPDGYEARSRFNANGKDLNRDFDVSIINHKGFQEKETRFLAQYLKQLQTLRGFDYRVIVDYHCCKGALLYPWSFENHRLPTTDLAKFRTIGNFTYALFGFAAGTTPEILGYSPTGTSKDYYYIEYGALAFSFEGRYREERQHINTHVQWWENISRWVLGHF